MPKLSSRFALLSLLLAVPASLLLLSSIASAAEAAVHEHEHAPGMPCDDASPVLAGHDPNCAMGCDGSPAPDRVSSTWGPVASRVDGPDLPASAAPAGWLRLAATPSAPLNTAPKRAPPALPGETPVDRKTLLLN